jgi:hypothetical protein
LAKQVVYLAPGILAKLDADPAIRQAVLALMERDAELAAKTGQPIRADPQRARAIIATGGFRGLFKALKKGVPYRFFLTASCTRLQQVDRLRLETVNQLPQGICLR